MVGLGMGPLALPLVWLLLSQNPAWPSADPERPASAFAQPSLMPGDPDFAPRLEGDRCLGQLELFGFTPDCTPGVRDEERALGSGIAADRAWTLTTGHPAVIVALADDGVDLSHPDLVARFILNAGELSLPEVGVPTVRHDVNGDGAFNVLDYTSATGTISPSIDRVRDERLLMRPDRGDTNGNGVLDPQDILRVFADGRDDDRNGYADDIAGWDFLQDDNDPSAPAGEPRGPQQALRSVGTANNGVGGAGVCPGCSALALRLSASGLAGADRGAWALLYASGRGARVIHVGAALGGASPLLERAVQIAFERDSLVVAAAGTGANQLANTVWPSGQVLVVGTVGHDRASNHRATSQVAQDPCARYGAALHVVAPGRCDDAASALAAGVAGLVLSAARGGSPERLALDPALTAGELWSVLRSATTDLAAPGWDARTGWGRLDALKAVQVILRKQISPHGRITAPRQGAVLDPSSGAPAQVTLERSPSRHGSVLWSLEASLGPDPDPEAFVELANGVFEPGDPTTVQAELPLLGWRPDPTSPLGTELIVQARFRDADGNLAVQRQRLHVHRDLSVMPAFPIELGAGSLGGVRALAATASTPAGILVATTDGRVRLFDGRAQPLNGFEYRGPVTPWLTPGGHVRLPEHSSGQLGFAPAAPILAPLSAAPIGPNGDMLIVGITADAQVIAVGPRGAVQAGFPVALRAPGPRMRGAAAGASAATALIGDQRSATIWVSDAHGALVGLDAQGRRTHTLPLMGPPGAPAVQTDGTVWVADPAHLYRFEGPNPTTESWHRPLEARAEPEGMLARLGPAPVLFKVQGQTQAVVAAFGGPLTRFDRAGQPQTLDSLAWFTTLGLADLDRDGQVDLLATVAPEAQVRGLAPAEAPLDGLSAFDLATLSAIPGFGAPSPGAPADPLIVDIGGDARPEVIFSDDLGRVWALGGDGRVARGFPKICGDAWAGAPAVVDLDGDGHLELVAVTRRGRLWAWRLDTPADRPVLWAGARGGLSGRAEQGTEAEARAETPSQGCRCLGPPTPLRPPPWVSLTCIGWVIGVIRRRGVMR